MRQSLCAAILMMPILINAFSAFWNFPFEKCRNYSTNFADYKIQTNTNVSFYGDKIVIFYEFIFGRYPYYKDFNASKPINGGLPQKCNLTAHLKAAEDNITAKIPNTTFDGLAIIDFEVWRPLFDQNGWKKMQVFQNESIKFAKSKNPGKSEDEVKAIAEKEFNDTAGEFFVETIRLGRKLRPNATWGFYGFPYCNYDAGKTNDTECWPKYQEWNNKMMFLFNESDALFPSIYLGSNATSEERFRYVQIVLKEARRIAKKFNPPMPIYAYTKIEYDPLRKINDFYNESSSTNMTLRCSHIKDKIEKEIGSKVKNATEQHESCRSNKCSGHGKCIIKSNTTCSGFTVMKPEDYTCECDQGFNGSNCSLPRSTPTTPKRRVSSVSS